MTHSTLFIIERSDKDANEHVVRENAEKTNKHLKPPISRHVSNETRGQSRPHIITWACCKTCIQRKHQYYVWDWGQIDVYSCWWL